MAGQLSWPSVQQQNLLLKLINEAMRRDETADWFMFTEELNAIAYGRGQKRHKTEWSQYWYSLKKSVIRRVQQDQPLNAIEKKVATILERYDEIPAPPRRERRTNQITNRSNNRRARSRSRSRSRERGGNSYSYRQYNIRFD